jgi:hypothetical protein
MNTLIPLHRAATDGRSICGLDNVFMAALDNPDAVTCPVCARNATTSDDPAHFLLTDGHTTTPTVHNPSCYICRDPEFAQMGLPLCYPCPVCKAHTPADDPTCDNGHDTYPEEYGPAPDGVPVVTTLPDLEQYDAREVHTVSLTDAIAIIGEQVWRDRQAGL